MWKTEQSQKLFTKRQQGTKFKVTTHWHWAKTVIFQQKPITNYKEQQNFINKELPGMSSKKRPFKFCLKAKSIGNTNESLIFVY